jgi:hypothetical protein
MTRTTTHLVARGSADVVATSQPLAPEVRDEIFALLHATRHTRQAPECTADMRSGASLT